MPSTITLSVPELLARRTEPRLRIMYVATTTTVLVFSSLHAYVPTNEKKIERFAPLDRPTCERAAGLQSIFHHYKIPSDFLSQRLQSMTHSFGAFSSQNSHSRLPTPPPIPSFPFFEIFLASPSTLSLPDKERKKADS